MSKSRSRVRPAPANESIKETIEALIIAFVLVFAFRAFVLEAFVIPTGSMAPSLLGAHHRVACEQCSYTFAVDVPDTDMDELTHHAAPLDTDRLAQCPMCAFDNPLAAGSAPSSGDRIFVQKHAYQFNDPQRWDVAVFKAPHRPQIHYIKRVVGLPGEAVHLFEGNVYVHPLDAQDRLPDDPQDWRIVRKTDRPTPAVQQTVFQPIYHSQYLPLDRGDAANPDRRRAWRNPWQAQGPTASAWSLNNRRDYRYEQTEPGRIVFDFERGQDHLPASIAPYNQWKDSAHAVAEQPIEQIRLATRVEPDDAGLELTLQTTARLHDGREHDNPQRGTERLLAHVGADGTLSLRAVDLDDPALGRTLISTRLSRAPLRPGRATDVELWFVDQEASLWIDGRQVLRYRMDPAWQTLLDRPAAQHRPEVAIALQGSPATLHRVELDRDIYYNVTHVDSRPAWGGLDRDSFDFRARHTPALVTDGQFFMIGDNAHFSEDSRFWSDAHPWLDRRGTEHQPGLVPRDLVMGQAFFVYYPGPLGRQPHSPRLIPNFADMRFIR